MKNFLIVTISLFSFAISSLAQKPFSTAELDKKLNELLKESHAPGFAIAIVRGDKVLYSKGFGYSNIESKDRVDENTLFAIGSTTKAFTTGLLGILEVEKGLSFDESPTKYLPQLKFYNDQLNTNLTIKDLVCHRSGLPRHDGSWYYFPTENKDSLLARISSHEPFADLRTQWYYNNFGYLIQGMITEKLTGKSWEDNIRERYFVPLQMNRSNLSLSEWTQMKNIAKGYEWKNLQTIEPLNYFNIAAISPAGSINSSVSEMSNWLKVWLNKGTFNGQQILPTSYVNKAMHPLMSLGGGVTDTKFPGLHLNSYGYAWFNSSYKEHYRLEHGGNIDGFSANVSLFPSDSLGIVVLTNQDGSMVPAMARNIAADLILGTNKTDWIAYLNERISKSRELLESSKTEESSAQVKNTRPSHSFKEYEGAYSHQGYGLIKVYEVNDSLFAEFPTKKYYLQHWHYDVFKPMEMKNGHVDSTGWIGFNMNFIANEMGDIDYAALKLEPLLDPIHFKYTPISVPVDMKTLSSYVGVYELGGALLKITGSTKESLFLDVPGQPQYTLIPVSMNEFYIKGLTGYKTVFESNGNGEIELKLIQPNGTFIAKKK